MANGKTLLAVDDDPGARRLLQFVLGRTGCDIVTAANGVEALAIVEKRPVDLLVTDLMMAGMDGFELTRALRRMPAYAELPIIMLSARGQVEGEDAEWNNEITCMMAKPFSPIELTARIQNLLKL